MPPRATGQVIQRRWKNDRTYALRFLAYQERHYLTLGADTDGWTRQRAEDELANIMADVRRGTWTPPAPVTRTWNGEDAPVGEPTFHRFASDWLDGRRGEIRPRTLVFYEWALSDHLLPYFAHWRLSEITIEAVDAYRATRPSSPSSASRPSHRGSRSLIVKASRCVRSPPRRSTRPSTRCRPCSPWPSSTGTSRSTPPRASAAASRNRHHGPCTSTPPSRSRRCSTPPENSTVDRGRRPLDAEP